MKYAALALSTIPLAILTWGVLNIVLDADSGGRPLPSTTMALQPLSNVQLKEQTEVMEALDALREVSMSRMRDFPNADGPQNYTSNAVRGLTSQFESIFALPPQEPERIAELTDPGLQGALPPAPKPLSMPLVNLVLQAGNEGRAMVNGQLVRVGDPVGEGMVVKSISMESVTFASGNEELLVAVPLERLRVLGAFPTPQQGVRR